MEGRYITLSRFTKGIQKNELIVWLFGDQETLIAQMTGGSRKTFDGPDRRFRGRLKLDRRTGDLTIRRMKYEHSGHYKLQISCSSQGTYYKTFKVVTNERGEQVQWSCEGKPLATGMNGDFKKTSYGDDERFRDRLELVHLTGDLIFRNVRTSDTGVYQLQISSIKKRNINREYTLTVLGNRVNESETAEMPLLSKEDVDGVNEQLMMSVV
ncbi:uncharacterized protein LOC113092164 isoform X2 [Carassius auratus]|uniref:Uncharacterized protein LOC113092164 isoform X2 n=1 Tax=Carassius auratus TaxID=7957 RepID=A0A6P6NY42_CARAU|nr:uncharacterized protein LOC113092164 isoform X2 [Carassius auratus]